MPSGFRAYLNSMGYNGFITYPSFNNAALDACAQDRIEKLSESIDSLGPFEDKRDYFVSNDIIESAGFYPKRNLDYGIKELIKLFVVLNESSITESELLLHCRKGLTAYKLPKEIVFAQELPKSNIGKILRRELRQ